MHVCIVYTYVLTDYIHVYVYVDSTSEEEDTGARESSAGFEKLDLKTFEAFGQDVHDLDRQRTEPEKEEEAAVEGGRELSEGARDDEGREERGGEERDGEERGREERREQEKGEEERREEERREEEREEKELSFAEGVNTSTSDVLLFSRSKIERAVSMGSVKPLALSPLKKWEDIQSLEQIGRAREEEASHSRRKSGRLGSVLEEDEDEQQQQQQQQQLQQHLRQQQQQQQQQQQDGEGGNKGNIQEFGSSAVYYKQADRERRGERERGSADIDVLTRVSQIEQEKRDGGMPRASPVKSEGVREGGVEQEMVRSVSVREKLKMFGGGGRKVNRSVSDSRVETPVLAAAKREIQQLYTLKTYVSTQNCSES